MASSWPNVLRLLVTLAVIGYANAQRPGGKPSITTQPQTFNVRAGDSLTLPCEVSNMGRRSLFWFKGEDRRNRELLLQVKYVRGRPVVPASFVSKYLNTGKYALNGTGLKLPTVEPLDAGEYTCSVSWVRQSIKHKLYVYDENLDDDLYDDYGFTYDNIDEAGAWDPDEEEEEEEGEEEEEEEEEEEAEDTNFRGNQDNRWRKEDFGIDAFPENGEVLATEGDDVTLTCRVRGYLTDPIWYLHGQEVAQGPMLDLKAVQRSQTGEYECRVRNQQFEDHSTFRVHVMYLMVEPETSEVEAESFGPAELACTFSGGAQPVQMEWFHNGELVRPDSVNLRQVKEEQRFLLQIAEMSEHDVGTYECRAYSDFGRSAGQMTLVPLPSVVKSFYTRSIPSQMPGKTTVQLFFEFISIDPIEGVEIYYTKANSEEGWVRVGLGRDRVYMTADTLYQAEKELDLDPDSEYYIQAKAYTNTGRYGSTESPRTFQTSRVEDPYAVSVPPLQTESYDLVHLQTESKSLPKWLKTSLLLASRLPILYRVFGN